MVQALVRFALRSAVIVLAVAVALAGLGFWAYTQLDIEAYPNPVAPMVEVITQPPGWSAEEVERAVTIPIETAMGGMVDLEHIRSQSLYGLSDVKLYFNWSPSFFEAQQRVLNRLSQVTLPGNLQPLLSPWSAIGEVFRYELRGKDATLQELKTAQDWILERQFRQVPGVIDVVSFGGLSKQYEARVDPYKMVGQGVTLSQVSQAIAQANQNVGGGRVRLGEQSYTVRALGLIERLEDIENVVVAEKKGVPVRVKDLADVLIGNMPRTGIVGRDLDDDVVQGVVLMRYGGDSLTTIRGIHERVELIEKNHVLPPGMHLVPYYDRGTLVRTTTHTVLENLLVGMLLVALVLWLFLGELRAALVTAANIPLALLSAFLGMVLTGTPANLISLGAVDFGIVVDSTVIMVENIHRHLANPDGGTVTERIARAAAEVGGPMFSSTLIIGVAFIPLFTLSGVAGVIFSPMAHTYAFAIGGAILLALTLTPVLARSVMKAHAVAHPPAAEPAQGSGPVMRFIDRLYRPLFDFALKRPWAAVAVALTPLALAIAIAPLLGGEFMPHLEEGNFWIRATLPMSVSLEQAQLSVGRMRRIVLGCPAEGPCEPGQREHPEVETVVTQLGRPEDGTDPVGFNNIEIFAPLAPHERWRKGVTKESLTEELSEKFSRSFPGITFNFSQAIADNVEEAMSGVKGENTIKVVGPDLKVDEEKAQAIIQVMKGVAGVTDLGLFRSIGQPDIRVVPNRETCARNGLNVGDVEAVVQAAIGGQVVTQVYEGEKHFDLVIRLTPDSRKDVGTIRRIPIPTPDGAQIPLGEVAEVTEDVGTSVVAREDIQRYVPVKFSVRGRDLASTVAEAQAAVQAQVKLPWDTRLDWAGEMSQLNEALHRLEFMVPLTLLLILFIVFSTVKTWRDTGIVLLGVPVACSGGVLALAVTQTPFSVSAAMGFISILGIAIQDALIVVTYSEQLWAEGVRREEGIRLACERRLRPVLMTGSVALLGLLPAALSRGIGSETQRPLAIVVIGGALALAVLPRLLQPALLLLAHRGDPTAAAPPAQPASAPLSQAA
jgi:heavy metal efflux system protein